MRGEREQQSLLARWVLTPYLGREASRSVHSERTIIHRPKSQNCHFPLTARNHSRHPPLIHACSIFVARHCATVLPSTSQGNKACRPSLPSSIRPRRAHSHSTGQTRQRQHPKRRLSGQRRRRRRRHRGQMDEWRGRGRERGRERRASLTEAGRLGRRSRSPARSIPCAGMRGDRGRAGREGRDQLPCGTARYGSGGSFVATFCREIQRRSGGVA